jgi:hypothetical protein
MHITKILVIVSIIIFFQKCDILNSEDSNLDPIDSKILFNVSEYHHGLTIGEPKIFINLSTEKIYGCFNYSIESNKNIKNRNIDIYLSGIYKPDVCLTACGPARKEMELKNLSGIYKINIKNKVFIDRYDLHITDSYIQIKGDTTKNTKPSNNLYWRYPENSMAYICGTTNETSTIFTEFLDTLLSEIELEEFFFPDSGIIPYPTKSSGYWHNHPAKYFYYQNDTSYVQIEKIVKKYKENHIKNKTGISIEIINWKNERIRSSSL